MVQKHELAGEILVAEQAAVSQSPGAGKGAIWVKDDAPNTIYFTDDTGVDHDLLAGGTPGGSNTQIQYNNAGAFGGDSGFTTNGTGAVNIVGDLDVDNLNFNGNTISSTNTNGAIIITPNGNGAIQADVDGNVRGTDAVDFQSNRGSVTQVASGNFSFIAAGQNNTASGSTAHAEGYACTASGNASHAEGYQTVAGGHNSHAEGFLCTTSGTNSHAGGHLAVAGKLSQWARASGMFAVAGDAQMSFLVSRNLTTNNTQTELFLNGTSIRIAIATDTTWMFSIYIVARRTDADNESAAWEIKGCIDNNAGVSALVGTLLKTIIGDDSSGIWDVTAEADNTNDALVIKVTGENAKTVRWVCSTQLVEVTG